MKLDLTLPSTLSLLLFYLFLNLLKLLFIPHSFQAGPPLGAQHGQVQVSESYCYPSECAWGEGFTKPSHSLGNTQGGLVYRM